MAQQMYNDIYIRDGLSDSGLYPFVGDVLWMSPDIVPYGQQFLSPAQMAATFLTPQAYGQDLATGLSYGTENFIYVRGKNLGAAASGGTPYLYWAPSSLLLMPNQWIQNPVPVYGGGAATFVGTDLSASIGPGAPCVDQVPFMWNPPLPTGNYHYCLIGIVVTPAHPNVYPPSPGPSGQLPLEVFLQWVRDNPAVAWRNLTVNADRALPSSIWAQNFSNPQPNPIPAFFIIECTDIPVGTSVLLQCPQSGPSPAIDATLSVTDPNDTLYFGTTLPATFGPASLIVTVSLPQGQTFQSDSEIVVNFATAEQSGGPLARFSTAPAQHGWDRRALARQGLDDSMQIVYLGNFVARWQ